MACFFIIIILIDGQSLNRDTTWSSNLTGVFHSSLALGDIDNDGDSDLIAMGCIAGGVDTCITAYKIKVYINNGTTFNENSSWELNTTNLGYGSLALGDINNDGNLDLVTLGDSGGGNGHVQIYINNGTTLNEDLIWEKNLSFIDAYAGSLALGDIDNDGKLDLALIGASPSSDNGIYINNGTSFVKEPNWLTEVPYVGHGLGMGSVNLADIDNDGDLDLIVMGGRSIDLYKKIYINNGTSFVDNNEWISNFPAAWNWVSYILGDYDNDGYLDLIGIGTRGGDHIYIYKNNQTTFLVNQTEVGILTGVFDGSIAFGDYDNDGDLDLGVMGRESSRTYLSNNTNNIFGKDTIAQNDMRDDNMQQGSLAWIDVNNDNNLDLIINGKIGDSSNYNFTVYISNFSLTKNNTPPTPPSTFISSYANGVLNLSWNNGSDVETNISSGLYYNLMVGNSTTNNTIVSGVYGGSSNPTAGYFGNMMQRKNISLNIYLDGTYYWYVQTIDTGLAKSNWSERQTLVVGPDTTPPNISSVSSSVTSSSATITWTTDENANSSVYYGTTTSTISFSGSSDLRASHSLTLNSLSASTLYYYNVSSCDYWGNCNTSIQYNFTTSAETQNENPPSGGGGSGGTITPTNKTIPKFDIDFSNVSSGNLEAKQGDIKTFSFNNEIKHSITVMTVTSDSITLLITSEPITIQIKLGETKSIDINKDNINDIEIKLISILNGKASFSLNKLLGADIVAKEELEKEALFDAKVSIVSLFQIVKSGREVIAKIEVFNVNNIGQVDVIVDYYITDRENNTIAQGSDTLAVEAVTSFVRSLIIPYNTKAGKYLFNVNVGYKDKIMASGSSEFIVVRSYEIFIGGGIIVLIVAGIFVYLWSIKRKERKIEEEEKRLKKEIKKILKEKKLKRKE